MISSNPLINIPNKEYTEDMCQAEREWGMEKYKEGYKEGYKKGYEKGFKEGFKKGILLVAKLVNTLLSKNRLEDAKRAIEDKEYFDKLIKELKLDV